jgi:hypothetical protein
MIAVVWFAQGTPDDRRDDRGRSSVSEHDEGDVSLPELVEETTRVP